MPALSRIGDLGEGGCPTPGHGGYTTQYITGASTVFTNNMAQTIIGTLGDQSCSHISQAITGSPTVFVENQAVHRIGDTGDGGAGDTYTSITGSPDVFNDNGTAATLTNNAPPDAPITIPPSVQTAVNAKTTAYVASPSTYAVDSHDNSPTGQPGQVKGNYPGTPDDGGQGAANIIPSAASAGDIIPFLDKILGEAASGLWRESGQSGRPSNPNILGIWRSLGYPSSGAWLSDQTAWCMGFVNYVLKNTGYRYLQTARAKDIKDRMADFHATQIPLSQAQPGDIALWSYSHVNFVYSAVGGKLTFVGGNQAPKASNNPNDGSVTRSWPDGYAPPGNNSLVAVFRPSRS